MTSVERLPELPASLQWPDRPGPVFLHEGLRGHVRLLLFWRLGCVHSRHALAELAALQRDFAGRAVAVVAVHTPVLPGERVERRWREVVAALPWPVAAAIDAEGEAARVFQVAAHPTLLLADAGGQVRFRGQGEPQAARLAAAVDSLLGDAATRGFTTAVPFAAVPLPPERVPGGLRSPAGLARGPDGRVWIADTGHHRLLAVDPATGNAALAVGTGTAGCSDGPAARATFRSPRGLASTGGALLVADTGNHRLCTVDAGRGDVATVCGTGQRSADRFGGGFGVQQGLCSPTGLVAHEHAVWCAQAGAHQIWQFDPDTQAASAWLGTGMQRERDGGENAAFAQPWALAADGTTLWVADAAGGSLRAIDLAHTTAGTRLQGLDRPLAVARAGDDVLVADGWRGTVLRASARGDAPAVVLAGPEDGLVEPSALLVVDDRLLVADAGAHCVWQLDLRADEPRRTLRTLPVAAVPPPPTAPPGTAQLLPTASVRAFAEVSLEIALPPGPDGGPPARLDGANVAFHVQNEHGGALAGDRHGGTVAADGKVVLANLPFAEPGLGTLRVLLEAVERAGDGRPTPRAFRFVLPVRVAEGGPLQARVAATA